MTEVSGEQLARLATYGSLHLLDEVGSTNEYALSLTDKRVTAIVVARKQTAGKGRFRRHWFSDDGSLTASVRLLTDATEFRLPSFLSQLAGLALARAVEANAGLAMQIRWPNDIIYKEKKLAGILCEGRRNAVAVGIGLNVNQMSFPESLPEAVSLSMATGRQWDRFDLLENFMHEMFANIQQTGRGESAQVIADIKARSALLHRRVEVQTLLRRHVGTVIDLDSDGRIVLRTDSGRLVVIGAGDARRVR